MSLTTLDAHIVVTPGTCGGKPRIAGRRIRVQDIAIWHERMGMSVQDIAESYQLGPADIHAALAYYFDHREEIDQAITAGDALVEKMRRSTPSKLKEKVAAVGDHGEIG